IAACRSRKAGYGRRTHTRSRRQLIDCCRSGKPHVVKDGLRQARLLLAEIIQTRAYLAENIAAAFFADGMREPFQNVAADTGMSRQLLQRIRCNPGGIAQYANGFRPGARAVVLLLMTNFTEEVVNIVAADAASEVLQSGRAHACLDPP